MKYLTLMSALVVGLGLLVGELSAKETDTSSKPAGNATAGKDLYLANGCHHCHGRSGQGGAFLGPAPVLAKTLFPLEAFRAFIRTPPGEMPAYTESFISDSQAADIFAYLQSLPGPKAKKDYPKVLQQL